MKLLFLLDLNWESIQMTEVKIPSLKRRMANVGNYPYCDLVHLDRAVRRKGNDFPVQQVELT